MRKTRKGARKLTAVYDVVIFFTFEHITTNESEIKEEEEEEQEEHIFLFIAARRARLVFSCYSRPPNTRRNQSLTLFRLNLCR
jgi:hypothetical protein